jgi:hypothetical protein
MASEDSLGEPSRPEVLLWHDAIHELQDTCRLQFWRLSFSPSYEREHIFARLRGFYEDVKITSHTTYETLGDYDLLLRLWVPRSKGPDEVELALWQALNGLKLWNINYLSCRTERHWAHGDTAEIPDQSLWPDPTDDIVAEVAEFNRRQFQGRVVQPRSMRITALVDAGVLIPIPLDTRGVRFFIIFDHPRVPFNPANRRVALETIAETCDVVLGEWMTRPLDVDGPKVSLYEGVGTMTDFLVMLRSPHTHFHEFVRDIALRMRRTRLDGLFDMRPYTHVIADQMFSSFAEDRPKAPARAAAVVDTQALETEELEFKATFALNMRQFMATREQKLDQGLTQIIVHAVCGMLNSRKGGSIAIGVVDVRRELERTKDKPGYLAALRDLFGCDLFEDGAAPQSPPNAVVGIEAEVGLGRLFSDEDVYRQRLADVLRRDISPNPLHHLSMALQQHGDRHVCVITAYASDLWFYAASPSGDHEEFYVREGNSTKKHTGIEADAYKQANPRGSGAIAN